MSSYLHKTYAGVLGKIIGVYLGRPVEGWAYNDIVERFGQIEYYVNDRLGIPVVTADDDISGSFAFSRAVVDHAGRGALTPQHVGETWLNYIIEDRTILWWGGKGRSTEHSAYLNLTAGVSAPASGSFARNGATLPVQVGAQIFVDGFAMMCPGEPERAAALARTAASVSHDGQAVEAAGFIAAMEALAYDVADLDTLLGGARRELSDGTLLVILDDVEDWCRAAEEWRDVRNLIEEKYGYHAFAGPCPVGTNFAAVVAALLLGGDSFHRAVSIAASAGWDTDSNAGVVGAVNGIRLGLESLSAEADLRGPVADQLLVVTADGGECISDAVRQTYAIADGREVLAGREPAARRARFSFDLPGSVQGFTRCATVSSPYPSVRVTDASETGSGQGLRVVVGGVSRGSSAAVSTPTFLPRPGAGDHFSTLASPTLYPGQRVRATVRLESGAAGEVDLRAYVLAEDAGGTLTPSYSPAVRLGTEPAGLEWTIPEVGVNPVQRLGFEVSAEGRFDGSVVVEHADWSGAPVCFEQRGILLSSIWDLTPEPLRAWVSSARHFEPDFRYTYSVSHPAGSGLATIGTRDWIDYAVTSTLVFNPHEAGGLAIRVRGHRRYYAAVLRGWDELVLVRRDHDEEIVLATAPFSYHEDVPLTMELSAVGGELSVVVDGTTVLRATDTGPRRIATGGAGFVVTTGTILADGFRVAAREGAQ